MYRKLHFSIHVVPIELPLSLLRSITVSLRYHYGSIAVIDRITTVMVP